MGDAMRWLERTTDQDEFFDYCLWEYKPTVPFANKLRSVNLLFHSFQTAGVSDRMFDVVGAIRRGLGPARTVWGLKQIGQQIKWEFYFYDYQRRGRTRSMTRLLEILRPYVRCDIRPNENLLYFMFSLDMQDELFSGGGTLDEIHMYIGNPGSSVSSGICYSLTTRGMRLENLYYFFDAKTEYQEIVAKIACSAHLDSTRIPLERILWPELSACRVIVVANKPQNDCIYFSRITVDQLLVFLKRLHYRQELVAFVEGYRSMLDHLLFDVGFDYRMEDGEVKILKSGYYGFF